MKFKIGDKVRLKTEKELIKEFGENFYQTKPVILNNMFKYLGCKGKIVKDFKNETYQLSFLANTTFWASWHGKWLKKENKFDLSISKEN